MPRIFWNVPCNSIPQGLTPLQLLYFRWIYFQFYNEARGKVATVKVVGATLVE